MIAGLECSYNPPRVWVFVPKKNTSSGCAESSWTEDLSLGHGTTSCSCGGSRAASHMFDSNWSLGWPSTGLSHTPFNTQDGYCASCGGFSFLLNYAEPRSRFPGDSAEFWSDLVPQVGCSSNALRQAMIGSGIMTQSLVKKETGVAQLQSRGLTLGYRSRAMRALTDQNNSILDTVHTTWKLWQLEFTMGNMTNAVVHMYTALRSVENAG